MSDNAKARWKISIEWDADDGAPEQPTEVRLSISNTWELKGSGPSLECLALDLGRMTRMLNTSAHVNNPGDQKGVAKAFSEGLSDPGWDEL